MKITTKELIMSVVQNNPELAMPSTPVDVTRNIDTPSNTESLERVQVLNEQIKQAEAENTSEEPTVLTSQQLDKVAQQLQEFAGEMNRGLQFLVDKDSGRDVIKVIDKSTGDLVKQFPSEEVLQLVAKLSETIGSFFDAKV